MTADPGTLATARFRQRSGPGHRLDVAFAFIGAVLIWATAGLHLRLYAIGYDRIPTIGWLFVLQGVAGSVLGLLILAVRHPLSYLAGAGYMASSIGGFLTSIWFGLFGFRDSFAAPYAGVAMAIEVIGAVVLLVAAAVSLQANQGRLGFFR